MHYFENPRQSPDVDKLLLAASLGDKRAQTQCKKLLKKDIITVPRRDAISLFYRQHPNPKIAQIFVINWLIDCVEHLLPDQFPAWKNYKISTELKKSLEIVRSNNTTKPFSDREVKKLTAKLNNIKIEDIIEGRKGIINFKRAVDEIIFAIFSIISAIRIDQKPYFEKDIFLQEVTTVRIHLLKAMDSGYYFRIDGGIKIQEMEKEYKWQTQHLIKLALKDYKKNPDYTCYACGRNPFQFDYGTDDSASWLQYPLAKTRPGAVGGVPSSAPAEVQSVGQLMIESAANVGEPPDAVYINKYEFRGVEEWVLGDNFERGYPSLVYRDGLWYWRGFGSGEDSLIEGGQEEAEMFASVYFERV